MSACVKCGAMIGASYFGFDRLKAAYCRDCFVRVTRHKFASALGKYYVFKNAQPKRAIVVYDYRQPESSALLLSLVYYFRSTKNDHKRLRIEPIIIVLLDDDAPISDEGKATRESTAPELSRDHFDREQSHYRLVKQIDSFQHSILKLFESFPSGVFESAFPDTVSQPECHFVHISSILPSPILRGVEDREMCSDDDKFQQRLFLPQKKKDYSHGCIAELNYKCRLFARIVSHIGSKSVRQEFLRLMRQRLLRRAARELWCTRIIVPDNAERLAADTFSTLCFGRGSSIAQLTGVVDNQIALVLQSGTRKKPAKQCGDNSDDCVIVRPLRNFSYREIRLLLQETVPTFASDTLSSDTDGLQARNKNNGAALEAGNNNDGGIGSLATKFLYSLQTGGFPATISTVLSVAGRAAPTHCLVQSTSTTMTDHPSFCALCFSAFSSTNDALHQPSCSFSHHFSDNNKRIIATLCLPCRWLVDELADCLRKTENENDSDALTVEQLISGICCF